MKKVVKSSKCGDLELFYTGEISPDFIFKNHTKLLQILKNSELMGSEQNSENSENSKGDFSFVLRKNDEYFIATSLFNSSLIYYYYDKENFSFAFDENELLKGIKKELNLAALNEYLSFGASKTSFFKNVYCLLPGSFLHFKNAALQTQIFDDFKGVKSQNYSFDECEEIIISALEKQIEKNLSKNPACLLSGGLDSSMLCALYQKNNSQKIQAFNLSFRDAAHYDESDYAKLSADFIGAKLHSINITKNDFLAEFYSLFDYSAEPLADSATLALKFFSKNITKFGFSHAFSAEGADECFLGYDLYFRVKEFYDYDIPSTKYPMISKDREHLRRKAIGLPIYASFCEVFTKYQKELLLGKNITEVIEKNAYDGFRQMRFMDLTNATNNVILKKLSLMDTQIITPFLSLVKFALSIENPSPNGEPKELLKKIAAKQKLLPNEIIYRKKKGLSTPFLEWILSEIEPTKSILKSNEILGFKLFDEGFVNELERKARRGRFKQHLWTLLCFSKWLEKHFG